ncbi:MAG: hypothetical protein JXB15_05710, partial [Anaerolineales bacterium]|nr:hypothetical protein [Anaerolineales bacterium]
NLADGLDQLCRNGFFAIGIANFSILRIAGCSWRFLHNRVKFLTNDIGRFFWIGSCEIGDEGQDRDLMLKRLNQSKFFSGLIVGVSIIAIWAVMGKWWPVGSDYHYTFRPTAEAILSGETKLYSEPGFGYYNAPWALLAVFPTLIMPPGYGQAVLTVLVMIGLVVAIMAIKEKDDIPPILLILAFANLHTFDAIVRGNLDGLPLIGLGLSWLGARHRRPLLLGGGLWLIACKPTNLILVVLFLLWYIRGWRLHEKIQVLSPILISILVTNYLIGWDWPIRYMTYIRQHPPFEGLQTSLWKTFDVIGLPLWSSYVVSGIGISIVVWWLLKAKFGREALALALSANLAFSPYVLGSHYTLLAPAFVILALRTPAIAWVWILTLTPITRVWFGHDASWIDIAYPLTLLVFAYMNLRKYETQEKEVISK